MKTLVLTLPGDVANLAPNERCHWREERRREKVWHWTAWGHWAQEGSRRFEGRVRISFTIRRAHALDEDNAAGSRALKAILDGLKDRTHPLGVRETRMIADDSPAHVERGTVRQEISREWRHREEVVVTVEALE